MTNFDRVKGYYQYFNEDERLFRDNSGRLEYAMTMKKLLKHLPATGSVLDLGGATGVYAFPLAEMGYQVYLADLSERLVEIARKKKAATSADNLISCNVVNAVDLSRYGDTTFDVVLLFGPLYHLLDEGERKQCIKEVYRVLKPGGLVFASFIPYLSGSIAIVDRYFFAPDQVGMDNLREVFASGKFINNANHGFQEGYYPTSDEVVSLFEDHGFSTIHISSIRSFAYEKEDRLYSIQEPEMFEEMLRLLEETSERKEIIETCGHAMLISQKS